MVTSKKKVGEDSQSPTKQTKTSLSNTYTKSYDAQFSPGFDQQEHTFHEINT